MPGFFCALSSLRRTLAKPGFAHPGSLAPLISGLFHCLLPGLVLALSEAAAAVPPDATAVRTCTFAVVRDGQSAESDAQVERLKQEILSVAGSRYTPFFPRALDFNAGWKREALPELLHRAESAPTVDAVLLVGEGALEAAANASLSLAKPTFGGALSHAALLPESLRHAATAGEGDNPVRALKPFFYPALILRTAQEQADLLRRLAAPQNAQGRWYLFTDAPESPATRRWCAALAEASTTGGAGASAVIPVAYRQSAEETLSGLPDDVRLVLCMPTLHLDRAGRAALFRGLAARRVAAFSFAGQRDVEDGALAGFLPETDLILARSVAVRVDAVAGAAPAVPTPLPATVSVQPRLYLNEGTARTICLPLSYDDLNAATRVGRIEAAEAGAPLTLSQAALHALEASFTIRIRAEGTVQARESQRMAAGALGPRLAATYRHQQVDRDRAEFAGVVLPETNVRAGLALEQPLLDDEALARHQAAREAYRAAGEQEKSARLEVVERALLAYLDALSARALLRISEENLTITEQNLTLARLRSHAGTAGPEETLRFESAAARQRGDVASAQARLARAVVALNRACSYNPDTLWRLEDAAPDGPAFAFSARTIAPRLRGREESERFLAWCSVWALSHSPDLATLQRQMEAQRIVVRQQARRPYVPRVSVAASLDRVVDMELGGATLLEQLVRKGLLPMPGHLPDRTEWGVALTAQLPLFTSGALSADLRRSRSALRQLEYSEADAREAIVARARAAFLALTGSYPNIELSRQSAAHADRGLELTRAKYEQGTVSVIALLDAQANAHAAREGAALAQYRFLADLVGFHRALGWHELLSTPEERDSLARDIDQALRPDSSR